MGTEKLVDTERVYVKREGESVWHVQRPEAARVTLCLLVLGETHWELTSSKEEDREPSRSDICVHCMRVLETDPPSPRPSEIDGEGGKIDGLDFLASASSTHETSRSVAVTVFVPYPNGLTTWSLQVSVRARRLADGPWQKPWVQLPDVAIDRVLWPTLRGAVDHAFAMYARRFISAEGEG
jgi:hypothetical protein